MRHFFSPITRRAMRGLMLASLALSNPADAAAAEDLWEHENLVAWCIVPFDAKKRDPGSRAEMLHALGFRHFAYDWRPEHVPTFDAEVAALQARGIELTAWWFPTRLDDTARTILAVIERHGIRPQLWVTGGGTPVKSAAEQAARIESELARLRPIVAEAARLNLVVGLYNHGGWFGEPDNQIALLQRLKAEQRDNVRLVYNFHHGHEHIADFAARWRRMAAFVDTVNLNGMVLEGGQGPQKIVYLAEGSLELGMMRVIQASGWRGRIGVLNHRTDVDAAEGLKRNLAGLDRLATELRAAPKSE